MTNKVIQKSLRVLVACEESQAVTKEFRKLGHEAYSCDIMECSGGHPEWHYQKDVTELLKEQWDMIIAFPPCTYISRAGARWMYPTAGNLCNDRYDKAMKAKEFFMMFKNSDCNHIAIENPTPLKVVGLPEHTQAIQPYEYGHPYSKRTLLWLKNLPELNPTNIISEYKPFLRSNTGYGKKSGQRHNDVPSVDSRTASKTFAGIAKAMAKQWPEHVMNMTLMVADAKE